MQRAFSLVELSIVLVILGLLTGGILAGQSLIRASELRSVSTEYSRYIAATQTFNDKYLALPGDMPNATQYWTSSGGNGANFICQGTLPNSTTTTCSGDGNGFVAFMAPSGVIESNRFWQHLALGGLLEGAYTGQMGFTGGTMVPKSKLGGAVWRTAGMAGVIIGDETIFGGEYGNTLYILNPTTGSPLKPEEAWNIDMKMDDGKPGYGKVVAGKGDGSTTICTTGDNVAPPADATATYVLNRPNKDCQLMFVRAF